ncbi:hypothetical protein ACFWIN_06020 [Streptomyces sp. NPDC127049]|uniref:hypothetical protein n=1 Tax=Streptomyces sp. NPDC127049 TaxID=3347118 RepID=UPI00365BC46F
MNLHRRHLSKGQVAMITVKARSESEQGDCSESEQSGRSDSEQTARALGGQVGIAVAFLGRASTVFQHAPDLVDAVINGTMGLDEAYAVARENKERANGAEAQLARLRKQNPELADRVVEGTLTLAGAWAEHTERLEEDKRQRRVATRLLEDLVPPLAQTRGTQAFNRYDPSYATDTPITKEVIAHAMAALTEMAQVWQERDLP